MKENALNHLAIIMDGNGRWAQARALPRTEGHKMGAKVIRKITTWCVQNHINFLTLYAFSAENWQRPKSEVSFLMKLLEKYLKNEEKTYIENNIKFKAIGDISAFSGKLQNLIFALEEKTAQNTALTQILALNYGSKDEIARAILKTINALDSAIYAPKFTESRGNSIRFCDFAESRVDSAPLRDFAESSLTKETITQLFENSLDTAGIPPVDLMIRTGGELRLSNFLLYQCAYAELFFSKTLFPNFGVSELGKIIADFKARNRRFGGL